MGKNKQARVFWAGTAVASALLGFRPPVQAAVSFVGLDTATPTLWNDAKNWSSSNIPGGTNAVLFDDAAYNLSGATIQNTGTPSVLQLDLGDGTDALTASFNINSSTGKSITLAANGGSGTLTGLLEESGGTQTINSNITLGKSQTWSIFGDVIVNGAIGDGGAGNTLTKSSGGTLELSGTSTFSGQFTLQGGTVILDNAAALGSSATVLLNSSASTSNASLLLSNGVTFNTNLIAQLNSAGKTITLGGAPAASGSGTFGGSVTLNQGIILDTPTPFTLSFPGIIQDGAGVHAAVTKTSAGTLNLSGANTFSGQFTLQGGTVILSGAGTLGTDTTDPVLLSTATATSNATLLLGNGVSLSNKLVAQNNANGAVIAIGGASTLTGSATFSGAVTLNTGIQLSVPTGGTVNFADIFSDGTTAGTVEKINGGTAVVSGVSTYSGGYVAHGGTTIVTNNSALGSSTTAQVSGTSSTAVASLLSGSGINLPQNILVVSNVNSGSVQYGAVLGGAPGQTASTWTGNIALNQPTSFTGGPTGTTTFSGNIADGVGGNNSTGTSYNFSGSAVTKIDTGTVVFSGSNTYSGATNISAGSLVLGSVHALPAGTNLTVAAGAQVTANASGSPAALTVGSLSLSGKLDLNNNGLVIQNGSAGTINALIASGYGGGSWNGTSGIVSTAAANDSTHLTALGVILNDNGANTPFYGVHGTVAGKFDNVTVADGNVLVKYTYFGDANLDGVVDGTDYSVIDNSYLAEGFSNGAPTTSISGWYNGDFNYDGVVNGSDYTLIDNAFNSQGASLAANLASPEAVVTAEIAGGTAAVPEPGSLGLLSIAAISVLSRRRKFRS